MNINVYPQSEESHLNKLSHKKAQRRKRKLLNKKNRKENKRNSKFSITMSKWAENFTLASNWQIKHELAYWKARAKALEYENGLLHDIIRKNHLGSSSVQQDEIQKDESDEDEEVSEREQNDEEEFEEYENDQEPNNDEFVVSEEYIEFVKANAKFKEDARKERERLKQQQDQAVLEEEVQDNCVMTQEQLKELYGDKWQRICALEMSLVTDFISLKDELNPMYWPNIPFNFN